MNRTTRALIPAEFGVPWLGFRAAVNGLFTANTTAFRPPMGTNLIFILSRPPTHSGDAADACPVSVGVRAVVLPLFFSS